jgi:hypothetical protein
MIPLCKEVHPYASARKNSCFALADIWSTPTNVKPALLVIVDFCFLQLGTASGKPPYLILRPEELFVHVWV